MPIFRTVDSGNSLKYNERTIFDKKLHKRCISEVEKGLEVNKMNNPNAYETEYMSDVLGETLRPGEFKLTQKAIELCDFTSQDKILDLGCGVGTTISFLYNQYNIKAVGIDASEKLLSIAKENCECANFVKGSGEALPFADESFDCVITEYTLALTKNLNATIQEVNRVLKKNGRLVVTDVYSKSPSTLSGLEDHSLNSCMRGLHNLEELEQTIKNVGFKSIYLGDYSENIKSEFKEKLMFSKLGYFILIALRGDAHENG